jgi:nucleoside-diphosphate-sugar epimerase
LRRHGPKSPDSPYETHSTSPVARPAPRRQHQDYPYQHTAATGIEIFIIANADTAMSRPNTNLIKEFYPDVEGARDLGEHDTLLSIAKARRLLGYRPAYSWRNAGTS